MRTIPLSIALFALPLLTIACKREDAPPPPPSVPPPTASTSPSTSQSDPTDDRPRQFPEDLDVDPQRDPGVRAKAKALNAQPVTAMKGLKPGDEMLVLVRADRGGGTIYGSGPYTIDSAIRKAAIHAGVLNDRELGVVRVKAIKPDAEHPSVPAHGITPTAYGKYHTSYTIERVDLDATGAATVPSAAATADPNRIVLHARDATVHGRTLRYEPQPNKNTLGFWTDPADYATWDFEITTPGTYAVEILQGCGKGQGGSTVNFSVGDQVLPVTVQDTGGFQNFVPRAIGRVTFTTPGKYTLEVKPVKKTAKAVMDLRAVTLTKAPS